MGFSIKPKVIFKGPQSCIKLGTFGTMKGNIFMRDGHVTKDFGWKVLPTDPTSPMFYEESHRRTADVTFSLDKSKSSKHSSGVTRENDCHH